MALKEDLNRRFPTAGVLRLPFPKRDKMYKLKKFFSGKNQNNVLVQRAQKLDLWMQVRGGRLGFRVDGWLCVCVCVCVCECM